MFVYTVKLNTNFSHHKELEKRFRMADDIYQKTLREILKRARKQKTLVINKPINYQKGKNGTTF